MQEEISLREYIDVIYKGKFIIISITVAALLLAGVLSYFVIEPTYETKATILINGVQDQGDEFSLYLNEIVSPQVYSERIVSSQLLKQVIEKYNLNEWDIQSLKRNIRVEFEKESKIMTISLKGNNPKLIQKTLEAIITESYSFIGETISNRFTKIADQYKGQLTEEKGKLKVALKEYNEVRASEGLPTIVLLDALTSEEKQYILNVDERYLDELQDLNKSQQVEFEKLNHQVNILTELYNDYSEKYEKARSASQLFDLENIVTLIAQPQLPSNPVSPNKGLNMAVAVLIGFVMGTSIVLFRNYWENTKKAN